MPVSIEETMELLLDKNNSVAYRALQELQEESEKADSVYPYLDRLSAMLESDNSYIRTRGIVLIACQAKWDSGKRIDKIIDKYLEHVTDSKPITARQCVQSLPLLAKHKPELREIILLALSKADLSDYPESMRVLVNRDIQKARQEIAQA